MVHLFLDTLIYSMQQFGGISRIFNEILPRMCDLEPSLHVTLLKFGEHVQTPAAHPQITQYDARILSTTAYQNRLWRFGAPKINKITARLKLGDTRRKLWHSTYFGYLPFWQGPYVVTVHDMIHERYPDLFMDADLVIKKKRREIARADRIICDSDATREDLIQLYNIPAHRIRVIYPGLSPIFTVQEHNPGERKYILYVGSRARYKGFGDLLQAYQSWSRYHADSLIVVGEKFTSEETQTIHHLGIEDRVMLKENITDKQLCSLYNQAQAFIFPSWQEGFGIPLLEAMACGCPIIASNIPTTREIAGDIPYFFEQSNPESLNAALSQAVVEGKNIQRIEKGFIAVKNYSWEKTAQETLEVYRSLLFSSGTVH
jgi:glycosyltransferase involved in cell wall biosynthesis